MTKLIPNPCSLYIIRTSVKTGTLVPSTTTSYSWTFTEGSVRSCPEFYLKYLDSLDRELEFWRKGRHNIYKIWYSWWRGGWLTTVCDGQVSHLRWLSIKFGKLWFTLVFSTNGWLCMCVTHSLFELRYRTFLDLVDRLDRSDGGTVWTFIP